VIKLRDLLTEVKPGDAFPSVGSNIDIIVDKFMGGKWKFVTFNLSRGYVSGVGVTPDRLINYDEKIKLSSSQKSKIKKILKNPEDIDYIEDDHTNIKVKDVLRIIR